MRMLVETMTMRTKMAMILTKMMTPIMAIMTNTSHPLPSLGGVEAVSLPRNILPKLALPKSEEEKHIPSYSSKTVLNLV